MKKRVLIVFIVALALTIGSVLVSWAKVNPPPVNQTLGIPDTVFDNITTGECRECHGPTPPPGVPVDTTYLPDRHHNLIDTAVTCPTDAPNVDCTNPANPVPSTYGCYECHSLVCSPGPPVVCNLAPYNNCNICHKQTAGAPTVHHRTDLAQAQDCKSCHGSLIDNPLDSHYIPVYQKSMVTPRTGLGQTIGPLGAGQGGCAYCHGPAVLPGPTYPPPLLDPLSGVMVYTNSETHHTALGPDDSTKCLWCHGTTNVLDIRVCERCHGVSSLHNIQVDSNASGSITPGTELSYYGHIGNNTDCNGCHRNTSASAAAPYSGPVIPNISGLSASNFTAGTDKIITVSGSAFTNTAQYPAPIGTIEYKSNVVLTAANGTTTTLTPIVITESSMDVTIPGTLAVGNYGLRAVKSDKASNLVVVSVTPPVVINSATCSSGVVTITGSGFSGYVNAVDSGTSVQLGANACSVSSWSDSQIKATCGTCSGTAEVNSVFGTASKTVVDVTPPTCTSFTYTAYSACVNGLQSRTVLTSSPAGCVGGNPVLTQTCVSNKPPVANAGPDKSANRYSSVKFDGSASKDPDGTITKYEWNFGDGTSGSGKVVYHKFTIRKTYTVTLKVTDNNGATATDTASVRIY